MKINKERSIGFYIDFISRQAHRYFDQKFKTFDMNRGSIYILKRLYKKDGIRQNDICETLHMDKANITRTLIKLTEMGYVRKEQDADDSRANRIFLTEKARTFKHKFHAIFHSWSEILTAGFSQKKNDEVKKILIEMSRNAESYFEKRKHRNE